MNLQYRKLNILSWLAIAFVASATFIFLGVNKAEAANPYIQNVFFGQDEQGDYISFDWVGTSPVTDNGWFGCRRDLVVVWFNRFNPRGVNTGVRFFSYEDGDFVNRFGSYSGFGNYAFASGRPTADCITFPSPDPVLSENLPHNFKVYINPLAPPERFSFTGNDFITIQLLGWNYNAQFIEVLTGDAEEYHYRVPENPLPAIPYANLKFGFNEKNQLNVSFDWIGSSKNFGLSVGFNGRVHDSVFTEKRFTPDAERDISMTWEQGGNLNYGYVDPLLNNSFFEKGNHYELPVKWLEKWTPTQAHKTNCIAFFWWLCTDPISKETFEDFLGRSLNSDDYITITSYFNDPNRYYFEQSIDTDTDSDGLLDKWETEGMDTDNDGLVDLFLGELTEFDGNVNPPDPRHRDVYVWIDWLEKTGTDAHSHKPNIEALRLVKEAFENAPIEGLNPDGRKGINLHVILGQAIGEDDTYTVLGSIEHLYSTAEFLAIKNFSLLSNNTRLGMSKVFHYAIYGHYLPEMTLSCPERSGRPVGIGGFPFGGSADFVIGHQSLFDQNRLGSLEEGGVFMHELGHALGLGHGGVGLYTNSTNYKPNHLSVMNYSFAKGLLYKKIGESIPTRSILDYSRFNSDVVPDLNESNLNEVIGLNSNTHEALDKYGTIYYRNYNDAANRIGIQVNNVNASIDWNFNGSLDYESVKANINGDTIPVLDQLLCLNKHSNLSTMNEWLGLDYLRGNIGFGTGTGEEISGSIFDLADPVDDMFSAVDINVKIDVKAGSDTTNPINLQNKAGVIPVAIITTESFDALRVDHTSVQFEGAMEIHRGDRRIMQRHEEDVNGDGKLDLVFHFRISDTTINEETKVVILTGKTYDGKIISGYDVVYLVKK